MVSLIKGLQLRVRLSKGLWEWLININSTVLYNKVLSAYQLDQVFERWKEQRFEDYLCPRPQGTDMAAEHLYRIYTCPSSVFIVAQIIHNILLLQLS
jgi:hypothetical protein